MMGGEIAEADPRRRRNDWLGFCQARTAARLRKVGDEPQDERANPSARRPTWERVRGFNPRRPRRHRRRHRRDHSSLPVVCPQTVPTSP